MGNVEKRPHYPRQDKHHKGRRSKAKRGAARRKAGIKERIIPLRKAINAR